MIFGSVDGRDSVRSASVLKYSPFYHICHLLSLDSRTDPPKVRYATALDWFLLMSFFYCIATLLEFAGVHYFTKVGSGEIPVMNDDEWEDVSETIEHIGVVTQHGRHDSPQRASLARKRNSMICPIYNVRTKCYNVFLP